MAPLAALKPTRAGPSLRRWATPTSILNLYRRLLEVRKGSEALRSGSFSWVEQSESVLAYRRATTYDHRVVVINFTDATSRAPLPPGIWQVEVATGGTEMAGPDGIGLDREVAVILRPG